MTIPLSPRLLACADFVSAGERVADVGCDHGYLSIYLLKNGIASSCIAADINEGPLQSAIRNANKYGVADKIRFYLSDGVRNVPRDFDTLVCAGIGADTIMSILSAAPWLQDQRYRIILQCQSKRPELRQWLYDAGYRIQREALAKDGKFVYSIMEVRWQPGSKGLTPAQTYLPPQLLKSGSPLLAEYYDRVMHGVTLTVEGMRRAGDERLPVFETILSDLKALEVQIYDHRQ